MDLKPGAQLASVVCGCRVVVVKLPTDRTPVIACGGHAMVPLAERGDTAVAIDPSLPPGSGLQIGKRYEADGLELLCTATGEGTLTCDGEPMPIKSAKPLPASD
jgi:hypothetical protein